MLLSRSGDHHNVAYIYFNLIYNYSYKIELPHFRFVSCMGIFQEMLLVVGSDFVGHVISKQPKHEKLP